jgi:hypothetical protein
MVINDTKRDEPTTVIDYLYNGPRCAMRLTRGTASGRTLVIYNTEPRR